jgi:hypothetical protein
MTSSSGHVKHLWRCRQRKSYFPVEDMISLYSQETFFCNGCSAKAPGSGCAGVL